MFCRPEIRRPKAKTRKKAEIRIPSPQMTPIFADRKKTEPQSSGRSAGLVICAHLRYRR